MSRKWNIEYRKYENSRKLTYNDSCDRWPSTVSVLAPAAITSLDVGGPGARRRQSDADDVGGVEALGSGAGMSLHRSRERCMRVVQPLSVR